MTRVTCFKHGSWSLALLGVGLIILTFFNVQFKKEPLKMIAEVIGDGDNLIFRIGCKINR